MNEQLSTKASVNDLCMVCGKKVNWGVNGCPVAYPNDIMGAFFGNHQGMIHYDCNYENRKQKQDETNPGTISAN